MNQNLRSHWKTLSIALGVTFISITTPTFFPCQSWAAGKTKTRISHVEVGSTKWRVENTLANGEDDNDSIRVFSETDNKELLSYKGSDGIFFDSASAYLLPHATVPLLATVWSAGARTLAVKIFDPLKTQNVIFETTSLSSVRFEVIEGKLNVVTYREAKHKGDELVETRVIVKAK